MRVDGIPITPDNANAVITEQLRTRAHVGPEDRSPLEFVERAYRAALAEEPATAAAISRALARQIGTSDEATGLAARFFANFADADGGEALEHEVLTHLDRYPPTLPDPVPGRVADTLRASLLRAALTWRTPSPALLAVIRAEVATPAGAWALLNFLWRRDREWVVANLDRLLAQAPQGAFPAYLCLKNDGLAPADAMRAVLAQVGRVDVDSFTWAIARDVTDEAERKALRALVADRPPLDAG